MHNDERALNVLHPTHEPRATDSIDSIIKMIEELTIKGFAYQGVSGDVYFAVSKFEDYGKLSGRNIDDLRSGERIAVNDDKNDPLDFVLWKMSKEGEPAWSSPWGEGRPGWHIECSAMSTDHLGNHFDIHGGGHDLQFPHHENEIAQSEACNGGTYANYWMHNGFIRIDDEKMSKSLGNFFTIREVLKNHSAEVIRFFMLKTHYRKPINYSLDQLDAAKNALDKLYNALLDVEISDVFFNKENSYYQRFMDAMNDDFNTAEAIAVLFELSKQINKQKDKTELAFLLKTLGSQLGILQENPEDWFKSASQSNDGLNNEMIEALIAERIEAKKNKDWSRADEIRDQLIENNIQLEDKADTTIWKRN